MKILISVSGTLGDILVQLPLLQGIRHQYPHAHITLLNKHHSAAANDPLELTRKAGCVDKIITVSKNKFNFWKFLSLFPYPGKKQYDQVFYLHRDGRSLAGKLKKDISFFQQISKQPVRGAVQLEKWETPKDNYPRICEMTLARVNTGFFPSIIPGNGKINFPEQDRKHAAGILASLHIPEGAIPFICCIGGKQQVTHYPIEKYRILLRKIVTETPAVPVFIGGPHDEKNIRDLCSSLPEGKCFYVDQLTSDLWTSICFMAGCAFYLGNDTGSMHMAAAAGLRCIVPECCHDPAGLWLPLGEGHQILRCHPEPECTSCRKQTCPKGNPAPCIDSIREEDLFAAVVTMLGR